LEKTFSDASFIATQSKKSIVNLTLATEENKEEVAGGWTSYLPLSALGLENNELGRASNYSASNNPITIQRKPRVRYPWK
jgi:hypothetical protein